MRGYRFVIMIMMTALLLLVVSTGMSVQKEQSELEYLAVFMDSKKVGYSIHSRRVEAGRVINSDTMRITINRSGVALTMKVTETSYETPSGEPLGFESEQYLGAMGMKVVGKKNQEGSLDVETTAGQTTQKSTLVWPEGALMAEGVQLLSMEKGLKEGTQFSVRIFTPMLMGAVDTEVRIGPTKQVDLLGRVVELTEVIMTMKMSGSEFTSVNYVDKDFSIQKMLMPLPGLNINLELIACSKEFALSENDVLDFIDKMVIASPRSLEDIKSTDSITYHVMPNGDYQLQLPSTDNQTIRMDGQGGMFVKVKPAAAPAGISLPYKGREEVVLEALKPTRFLQSDSEEIKTLAKKAIGNTRDAAEAAWQIESFVHEYITEKDLSVGYASAVEVAASGQGDCSEHAVLTAAMCRAVGIPARVTVGYVYVSEFDGRENVFGGHAWTEVFIGDKWIGLDATRALNGYSAGYITQATSNGNPEDFLSLVNQAKFFKIVGIKFSVLAPSAAVEKLSGGFRFTEGPAADAKGNIYFTDIPNNRIHVWSPGGKLSTFKENSGGANGLFFDKKGNLFACAGGGRQLIMLDAQGKVTVLADKYDDKRLNSPNDLWLDAKGGIYFTDPRYGNREGIEQDGEHVYYLSPKGKLIRVVDDLVRPNGIIGTPDGKKLYVADLGGRKTYVYTINPDGTLTDKKLFADSGSDGMTVDNEGNVYLTGREVLVFSADGEQIETIAVPERPSNVCFGGKDKQTLFITARTSLYSVRLRVKGI